MLATPPVKLLNKVQLFMLHILAVAIA